MWNLTPEYIQQVKEELKGRRAAIEARYAEDLKAIAEDLDEIEELERLAYAIAVKHLPEVGVAGDGGEPAMLAELQGVPGDPVAATAEPVAAASDADGKGASRWRMRLDPPAEGEPA